MEPPAPEVTRDFAVATLVVWQGKVLLHWHAKLGRWLPPGGHVEPNELPEDAAVREAWEETGVRCQLLDADQGDPDPPRPGEPRRLSRPAGLQLALISPGPPRHEHIDFIYFAIGEPAAPRDGVGWFGPAEFAGLNLTDEVAAWCDAALAAVAAR